MNNGEAVNFERNKTIPVIKLLAAVVLSVAFTAAVFDIDTTQTQENKTTEDYLNNFAQAEQWHDYSCSENNLETTEQKFHGSAPQECITRDEITNTANNLILAINKLVPKNEHPEQYFATKWGNPEVQQIINGYEKLFKHMIDNEIGNINAVNTLAQVIEPAKSTLARNNYIDTGRRY